MESRDAVTYLLMDEEPDQAVIAGYCCLSSGAVLKQAMPADMARRVTEPIPAVRMGRFVIDHLYQGRGLGGELLAEALLGAVNAGRLLGARVMLVDAIDEDSLAFYQRYGFEPSPVHELQVLYDLRVVAASTGLDDQR